MLCLQRELDILCAKPICMSHQLVVDGGGGLHQDMEIVAGGHMTLGISQVNSIRGEPFSIQLPVTSNCSVLLQVAGDCEIVIYLNRLCIWGLCVCVCV